MKTILVLSAHPDFAETISAGLNSEHYRIVHRIGVDEAEPLLAHGLAAACILDIDLMGVEGAWSIERLRRRASKLPVIAYTACSQSEWEEEAFLQGISHVLTKPVLLVVEFIAGTAVERACGVRGAPGSLAAGYARPHHAVFPRRRAAVRSRPVCQCRANPGHAARLFAHHDAFARCRGDDEAISNVSS